MRWAFALFFGALALISIAAFVDACDSTGTAHDRAIVGATIGAGGAALALIWGRFAIWVPLVTAGLVAVGTLAVMESLQFGACVA